MEFTTLTEKEFNKFIKDHPQSSFLQTIELANLKKELGNIPHILGIKKDKKVVAATIILEEKSILLTPSFNRSLTIGSNSFRTDKSPPWNTTLNFCLSNKLCL